MAQPKPGSLEQTPPPVGVPFESAEKALALCEEIDSGRHDPLLDRIEGQAKARRTFERRVPKERWAKAPAGAEQMDVVRKIQHGLYSGGYDAMDLIIEAARNRRSQVKYEQGQRRLQELRARQKPLKANMRVRVHPEAPVAKASEVLLGKRGTVERVNRTRAVVRFDEGQPMGKFRPGSPITVPTEMLEILEREPFDLGGEEAGLLAQLLDESIDSQDGSEQAGERRELLARLKDHAAR